MSKKSQRKGKQKKRQTPASRFPRLWLAVGGVLLLIAGALLVLRPWSGDDKPQSTPQVAGTPRLMVDQTTVDHGYIKYDVPVRTTFRLSNVGDQQLEIVGAPQVQLIQGC
jgi:hypothetical protein